MGRLFKPLTALGVAALLLAGGGAYALASSTGTITVCVKHAGGGLYKATKCTKRDKQLSWNARGPAGATGATGAPGPQGQQGNQGTVGTNGAPAAVQVAGWSGQIAVIPASSPRIFIGPTATLTTTAADPTIVASGSAALGTSSGTGSGALGICYQAASGGDIQLLDDNPDAAIVEVAPTTNKVAEGVAQTGAPGAGTWNVGICFQNLTSQAVGSNDWSVGWAMVTAGTPTSQ
jgi:hypothetical protein